MDEMEFPHLFPSWVDDADYYGWDDDTDYEYFEEYL